MDRYYFNLLISFKCYIILCKLIIHWFYILDLSISFKQLKNLKQSPTYHLFLC